MLMINNHFARFQLPGNLLKTKKMCSLFSWQHAIPIYSSLKVKLGYLKISSDYSIFYQPQAEYIVQ
jgi:hypothetical protein